MQSKNERVSFTWGPFDKVVAVVNRATGKARIESIDGRSVEGADPGLLANLEWLACESLDVEYSG